jgi:Domain of unknown function (DUF5655)
VKHVQATDATTRDHGPVPTPEDATRTPPQDVVPAGWPDGVRTTVDELLAVARALGDDVEVVAGETGLDLRRRTRFAVVAVPSARRVRLGLNLRDEPGTERLRPASGPCTHAVEVADPDDVDDELVGWLRAAYDRAS